MISSFEGQEATKSPWYCFFLGIASLGLPTETQIFVNESLGTCYQGLWNKRKSLNGKKKIQQFYTRNKIICLKLIENGPVKVITHNNDLKDLFPGINVNNL